MKQINGVFQAKVWQLRLEFPWDLHSDFDGFLLRILLGIFPSDSFKAPNETSEFGLVRVQRLRCYRNKVRFFGKTHQAHPMGWDVIKSFLLCFLSVRYHAVLFCWKKKVNHVVIPLHIQSQLFCFCFFLMSNTSIWNWGEWIPIPRIDPIPLEPSTRGHSQVLRQFDQVYFGCLG